MKIFFASDHAGFELKGNLIGFVKELGFEVEDLGPYEFNPKDDYPEFVSKVAREVSKNNDEVRGIILGKTGEGEGIVANRFKGVRACVFYGGDIEIIKLSREHNNSNILSLGAGFLSVDEAREVIRVWLHTDFSGEERHIRRIREIDDIS